MHASGWLERMGKNIRGNWKEQVATFVFVKSYTCIHAYTVLRYIVYLLSDLTLTLFRQRLYAGNPITLTLKTK